MFGLRGTGRGAFSSILIASNGAICQRRLDSSGGAILFIAKSYLYESQENKETGNVVVVVIF